MSLQRVSFTVHGTVQGVFFRNFTQNSAQTLNVTGWVKNTPEGKVTGEAQGTQDQVAQFMKKVDQGPKHANVVKLERKDVEVREGEEGFEIK